MLNRWLKGLTDFKGIPQMITPARFLGSVLVMLNTPHFEPLKTTSLKYLAWKTILLLAFTFTQ